jgi:hypothetical protein
MREETGLMPCPFCGGKFNALADDDNCYVLHTVPECEVYRRLNPLEFVCKVSDRLFKGAN